VTIVPDGFLWNVPFDALMTPSHHFLLEEHALAYAPSLMMLDAASRRRRPAPAAHELLAVGDPMIASATRNKAAVYRDLSLDALPDAAREARAVATLYGTGSKVLTHATASEAAVKELAPGYRILHLATHGFVDDESPLYSALVLSSAPSDRDDGLLEMREVRDLDLHADLIVLSACDTARGTVYPGEGVIGLSWAFLTSGCPTTVVSQWNVESHSTSTLMVDFHKRLLAGDNAESALRRAKLALMRDKRYAHPLYWAPFIVVGNGVAKIR
jgi:CHAT domain-containing protein